MNNFQSTLDASGGTEAISGNSLIAVTIEDLGVATANFISKERGNREGFVQVQLNGQTTIIPFRGKAKKGTQLHPEIGDRVLYVGPHPGILELDIRVIETNAASRKLLANLETITKMLSSVPMAGIAAIAAPASGLIGGLSHLLRSQTANAHEAIFLSSWDKPIQKEQNLTVHMNNAKGVVATLQFHIHDLGIQKGKAQRLSVNINNPRFEWSTSTVSVRTQNPNISSKSRKKTSIPPAEYLQRLGFSEFSFEASSGRKHKNLSLPTSAVFSTLNWQQLHCFQITQPKSGKNRLAIPLQIDFSLNRSELPLDALADLSNEAAKLGRAIDAPLPPEIETIRRKMPSLLSQLADLTPHALTLGSFDGIVILTPDNAEPLPSGNGILVATKQQDSWRATLSRPILLSSDKPIGSFIFDLEFTVVQS